MTIASMYWNSFAGHTLFVVTILSSNTNTTSPGPEVILSMNAAFRLIFLGRNLAKCTIGSAMCVGGTV